MSLSGMTPGRRRWASASSPITPMASASPSAHRRPSPGRVATTATVKRARWKARRSNSRNAASAEGAHTAESPVNAVKAASSAPQARAGRGRPLTGQTAKTTASNSAHQTTIAATLRVVIGEPPPSSARPTVAAATASVTAAAAQRRTPLRAAAGNDPQWRCLGGCAHLDAGSSGSGARSGTRRDLPRPVRQPVRRERTDVEGLQALGRRAAERARQLPPAVQRRIEREAGADAADLAAIATEPDAGAPARQAPSVAAATAGRRPASARRSPEVEDKPALSAAAEATFGAGGGGLALLLVGLLGTTALVGGFAVSRRRSGGS